MLGEALELCCGSPAAMDTTDIGDVKLNFDGAKLGEWGHGWGAVARDNSGNELFAGMMQGVGFLGAELEEARAARFALGEAKRRGLRCTELEGDCLTLISKLKKKEQTDADIGIIIYDIISLAFGFDFYAFSFVNREGNKIAHCLAHIQPYDPSLRIWLDDLPDDISHLVLKDISTME